MKSIGSVFLLLLSGAVMAEQTPESWLISALYDDQKHRAAIHQLKQQTKPNQALIDRLVASQNQLDEHNQEILQQVIDELGHWPGVNDVGENASKISLLLFNRSTPEQQAAYLPLIHQEVMNDNLPASWYAELADHHQMNLNAPQPYGHLLVQATRDGSQSLYPIDNLTAVNQRRAAIGLVDLQMALGQKNWLLRINQNRSNNAGIQSPESVMKMATLALNCLDQVYPNSIKHVLNEASDAAPPDALYPAFFGCFDWHSSVHGHWLLARLARLFPNHPDSEAIMQRLDAHFTAERLTAELDYFQHPGRQGFERPYGLAWFLQLYAEIHDWPDPRAQAWKNALEPLKIHVVQQLSAWIPKLAYPIRGGEHSQTAFAFGLAHDYARLTGDDDFLQLLNQHSKRLYQQDRNCPIDYEPSGHDFLSPCLAEADLMRRVLPKNDFRRWLKHFLPDISKGSRWLPVARVTDRVDGKLAHLDGLNLSRAWMLEGLAHALPSKDNRRYMLSNLAELHADAGLAGVTGEHYSGGHWLGSFATYYLTQRGLAVHQ